MKQKNATWIFLILAIMCNTAYTQNDFPDGDVVQKWEYVTWYFWGGQCEARKIKTGNKVQKCTMEYIEVWDCNANENDCSLIGYYRLQGDSVLVRTNHSYLNGVTDTVVCNEPEGLMYDFSSALHDTLICQINSTWPPTFTKFWGIDKELIEFEGIERQTTTLNYIPHPNAPYFLYTMQWIDGIGSNVHPFYSFTCIGDHCEREQQVTKVLRNEQIIYQDTLSFSFPCNGWVNTQNEAQHNLKVTVLPNPAGSYITISSESETNNAVKLNICDVHGKVISYVDHYEFGEPISIVDLSAGIYIIQVFDGNLVQSTTFIKE